MNRHFEIYCDGASGNQVNKFNKRIKGSWCATWGFVLVCVVEGNRYPVTGYFGNVVVDEDSPEFIGAEGKTNQTAELSAMNWAIRWLAAHKAKIPYSAIYSDSKYAIHTTEGDWVEYIEESKNGLLIQNNRDVYEDVSTNIGWVKGHSGNTWNDLADLLAQKAKRFRTKRMRVGQERLKKWIEQA